MTIANKLALLEQTKEAQRVKLGLPKSLPFSRYVNFMRAWAPDELFANGEQGVWLDPSDLSTMFQDVAGTVPVTKDGDPVALIKDKSGNKNHATQTAAARRPIYRTDGNLHWLRFDGVDDRLEVPVSLIDRIFTFGFGYLKPLQSTNILLVDSFKANPWGIAGAKGNTSKVISNTNGEFLSIKGNGASSMPKTRDDVYTLFEDNNVITFAASFRNTESMFWSTSFSYGAYTGVGYNAFSKLTGLILIEGQQTDIQLDTYLAKKSRVTL